MTLYLDSTVQSKTGSPIGVIAEKKENIVFAGTTIHSMDSQDNNSTYRDYALNSDVNFIFDDAIPSVDFYSVPRLDLFGFDSQGGYLATRGEVTDMHSNAPIYYVDADKNCFNVAENLKTFIDKLNANLPWRDTAKAVGDIAFYPSRESAMQALSFIPIPKNMLQTS